MLKKGLLSAFLLLASLSAFSQKTDFGNWFIYFSNSNLNDRWSWWNEVQYRNYNFIGDLEQLLLRTALQYNLSENNNTVSLGYGYIKTQPYIAGTDEKRNVNESRIYQQFVTKQRFSRVYFTHRYRFEQRFVEDDFRIRFRYFLSLNVPLNRPAMEPGAFYLSAYDEVFLNGEATVFDRNRLYGGIGYFINPNLRFETGIMSQMLSESSRPQLNLILHHNINWGQD